MFRQVLTLTEASQRNQAALKELQKEVRDLAQTMEERQRHCESAIERLVYEMQRLRDEINHATRHEADEREKFQLKLENQLLKSGRLLSCSSGERGDEEK